MNRAGEKHTPHAAYSLFGQYVRATSTTEQLCVLCDTLEMARFTPRYVAASMYTNGAPPPQYCCRGSRDAGLDTANTPPQVDEPSGLLDPSEENAIVTVGPDDDTVSVGDCPAVQFANTGAPAPPSNTASQSPVPGRRDSDDGATTMTDVAVSVTEHDAPAGYGDAATATAVYGASETVDAHVFGSMNSVVDDSVPANPAAVPDESD